MRKKLLTILAIFTLMIVSACSSGNEPASGEGEGNGKIDTFTYASLSDAVGLSPIMTNDSASANVTDHVYEKLFDRNTETMEIEPKLAESYENPDENTWLIKLKEGVKFHDGTDFNAEAVKYTFDKLRDPETAAPRASLMEPVESINVIDDYTVEIKTKYPYGPFLAALSHSNAAIVSPTADKEGDLNKEPVGTGPFKFAKWVPGDQVVLEANEDYRDGAPAIQQLIFKVVPEISTAISMLQTGEVQFIDNLPMEQIERIESLKNVTVEKVDGTPEYYFTVNHGKEEYQDAKLREAFASAIDRDAVVSKMNGLGIRSDSVIGPKVFGYVESAAEAGTPYDLEKAKSLVEENGFGEKTYKLLTPNRSNFLLMAEIVQAQLSEAGFKIEIESMEWASFLDTARQGNFDLTFLSWSNLTADGSELFYPNFHTDNVGASNRAQYSNEAFDQLVDESRTTTDQDKRLELLDQANRLMLDDDAVVIMYHSIVTAAMDQSYEGLLLEATGKWNLSEVTRK
ncbi:ABC transporter substrate-binding protein [Cytobacillus kochii]|uniref:ABC transporter substrate-binding protein n=1 Tax=Cytobacillus kochii TaxID=859143 RepID=UPI002E1F19AD|nr:ABC transporter substrate-binding protein [Cytobacillus kochii]